MLVLLIIIGLCKRNKRGKKIKEKKKERKEKSKGKIYRKNYPVKISVSRTECLANGSSNKNMLGSLFITTCNIRHCKF